MNSFQSQTTNSHIASNVRGFTPISNGLNRSAMQYLQRMQNVPFYGITSNQSDFLWKVPAPSKIRCVNRGPSLISV